MCNFLDVFLCTLWIDFLSFLFFFFSPFLFLSFFFLAFGLKEIFDMAATGQEMVGEKFLQGQGKVREFHFESGRSEILREHVYSFPSIRLLFSNI